MSLGIFVAATKNDWVNLFHHVKGGDTITFYAKSTFDPQKLAAYSIEDMPNLGVATSDQMIGNPSFTAMTQQQMLMLKTVHRNDGSTIYLADEGGNRDAFTIFFGGTYDRDFFIVSRICSMSNEGPHAIPIAKRLIGRIRRTFHRGNFCWIGPECYALYNSTRIFTDYALYTSERMPGINTMFENQRQNTRT